MGVCSGWSTEARKLPLSSRDHSSPATSTDSVWGPAAALTGYLQFSSILNVDKLQFFCKQRISRDSVWKLRISQGEVHVSMQHYGFLIIGWPAAWYHRGYHCFLIRFNFTGYLQAPLVCRHCLQLICLLQGWFNYSVVTGTSHTWVLAGSSMVPVHDCYQWRWLAGCVPVFGCCSATSAVVNPQLTGSLPSMVLPSSPSVHPPDSLHQSFPKSKSKSLGQFSPTNSQFTAVVILLHSFLTLPPSLPSLAPSSNPSAPPKP